MVGDSVAVWLNPCRKYIYVVVIGVVMGIDKIWLLLATHAFHKFSGKVCKFLRCHNAPFNGCRHVELETVGIRIAVGL